MGSNQLYPRLEFLNSRCPNRLLFERDSKWPVWDEQWDWIANLLPDFFETKIFYTFFLSKKLIKDITRFLNFKFRKNNFHKPCLSVEFEKYGIIKLLSEISELVNCSVAFFYYQFRYLWYIKSVIPIKFVQFILNN